MKNPVYNKRCLFKTFSVVAKQWLKDYFEKYPDRREIIIPKFTSEQHDA